MKRYKRLLAVICMVLVAVLPLAGCSNSGNESDSKVPESQDSKTLDSARTISVLEVSGEVIVESKGQEVEAFQGMRLRPGDVITTNTGAVAYLDLDSDKLITIDENSSISLDVASGNEQSQKTELTVVKGTACSSIAKLSDTSAYDVKTANFTMGVRGTIFVVKVDDKTGNPEVSVIEGRVEAKPNNAKEKGIIIEAQQSASPTEELWEAFLADDSVSVTRPLDMSSLSTPILSSVLVELEARAQEVPELKNQLQKMADSIKATNPEAAEAAKNLTLQLEEARKIIDVAEAAVDDPAANTKEPTVPDSPAQPVAATPPVQPVPPIKPTPPPTPPTEPTPPLKPIPPIEPTVPVKPTDPAPPIIVPPAKPDVPDGSHENDKGNNNGNNNSGGGGGGGGSSPEPPTPEPPTPEAKLNTPEVTVNSFTAEGFDISFTPVDGAVSYTVAVSGLSELFFYDYNVSGPEGTEAVTLSRTFDTPITQTGSYSLSVMAVANKSEFNSDLFIHEKLIEISTEAFEVLVSKWDYKSTSLDIIKYPRGANAYDVLVRRISDGKEYLSSRNNSHAHFESQLTKLIDQTGEYELVITPKYLDDDDDDNDDLSNQRHRDDDDRAFTPYIQKVSFTKNAKPVTSLSSMEPDFSKIQITGNSANYPNVGTEILEAEFLKDGEKIVQGENWKITITDTWPQIFVLRYVENGNSRLPQGSYSVRLRTITQENNVIPSDWTDAETFEVNN